MRARADVALAVLGAIGVLGACGGEHARGDSVSGPPTTCDPQTELPLDDGTCARPGVPVDGCGEGFEHDGEHGCVPVLVDGPCPAGQMAVVGESVCRPVMACPTEPWGGIAAEADTQYVDASFTGPGSDGTMAAPWPTIGEAVAAAAPGAIVAIEAGTYPETVVVAGKAVRLWGVCPDAVIVAGTAPAGGTCPTAGVCAIGGATGSEVRGVTLTGDGMGMIVSDADVVARDLRVHDCQLGGLVVESTLGPAHLIVDNALVEANLDAGIRSRGGDVTVQRSLVRDSLPGQGVQLGRGISVVRACDAVDDVVVCVDDHRPLLDVSQSVISNNQLAGIFVSGADATLVDLVVRGTRPRPEGSAAIVGSELCHTNATCLPESKTTIALSGSVLNDNAEIGLYVRGSSVTMDRTVVQDTGPSGESGRLGLGVLVQPPCVEVAGTLACDTSHPGELELTRSLVTRGFDNGVLAFDSSLRLTDAVVSHQRARPDDGTHGDGVAVVRSPTELSRLLVDDTDRAGVATFGSAVTLASTALRCAPIPLSVDDFGEQSATIADAGNNRCGCPIADATCKAASAVLEPPEPIE